MTMTALELMVKSSIQIFQAEKDTPKPEGFGTGFIAKYLNQFFLISVSHVTNNDELTTFLETNMPSENNKTPLKPIGGLVYYDLLKITDDTELEDFKKLIEDGGERLDITFAKLNEQFELVQPEMDFGFFKVKKGSKLTLNLDYSTNPDKNETYGFYGKIRPEYQDYYLKMTPTLKHSLTFYRTIGNFHMFLAPEVIKDRDDYKGCSGAPILDSEGRIVALACKIIENSKVIYGFSIEECKRLIKITNDANQF